jgi:hypothetical protein
MPYHAVTIFSVVLLSLETVVTLLLVVHGAWMLHNYRQSAKYRSSQSNSGGGGGGNARNSVLGMPFPLLLRVLYLTASCSFVVGVIVMIAATLSFVEPEVMQDDPVHPVNKWPDLSSQGRMCILMAKFCPLNYILMKFYSYMFFFIKQRTVRQMEPKMGRLEKVVLQNTFSMFLLIGVAGWLVQGDRSDLDGTCVMWIPIYLLLFMASADCVLSSAYLYLFLQPLRATIALNAARSNKTGASVAINVARVAPAPGGGDCGSGGVEVSTAQPTAPSDTSGGSGGIGAQRSVPSSPSVAPVAAAVPTTASAAANAASLSLQRVMQRNFRAVTASIISSSGNMFFLTIAILTDQPHMRKLVSPLACFDCCVMLASLGWVLHGGKANAASSSSVASTTAAPGAGARSDEALALSLPVAGTNSLAARPARGAHLLAPAGGSSHGPPLPLPQDTLHNNFLLPASAAAAAASPSSPVGAAVLGLGLAPTDAQ